ncbi:hypothetical protein TNCV_591721 [Trichonephila clavipes]|nr:hypothetical protein TNCV_591721 [Trichonephila clavipes]
MISGSRQSIEHSYAWDFLARTALAILVPYHAVTRFGSFGWAARRMGSNASQQLIDTPYSQHGQHTLHVNLPSSQERDSHIPSAFKDRMFSCRTPITGMFRPAFSRIVCAPLPLLTSRKRFFCLSL